MVTELNGRKDVLVLAQNSGADDRDTVARFWKDSGFTFDALLDAKAPGSNAKALGVRAYPTNFVIGPDGTLLYASTGFEEPRLRALLGLPPNR